MLHLLVFLFFLNVWTLLNFAYWFYNQYNHILVNQYNQYNHFFTKYVIVKFFQIWICILCKLRLFCLSLCNSFSSYYYYLWGIWGFPFSGQLYLQGPFPVLFLAFFLFFFSPFFQSERWCLGIWLLNCRKVTTNL